MSDLSDYGGGIEPGDLVEKTDDSGGFGGGHYDYRNGRCKAITTSGSRCRSPCVYDSEFCHTHKIAHRVTTIDDGPRELIAATTRTLWKNFDNDRVKRAVHCIEGEEVRDG